MTAETDIIDPRALRRALGNFITGVTIVTTMDEIGRPRGLTANSFTSVSLDPPLVLVCIAHTAASCEAFQRSHGFAVNVLHEDQRAVAELFASKSPEKFDHVGWRLGPTGAPRLDGSLAVFDCRVFDRRPAGDHLIIIGQVMDFETTARRPLVYAQGGYISVSVQQAAVAQPSGRVVTVNCIADYDGRVLLVRGKDGAWELPGAVLAGTGSGELLSLKDALSRLGAKAEITFLYSVFETAADDRVVIVYRGTLSEPIEMSESIRLFAESEVPWEALKPQQCVGMLRRFFREHALDQFGIYTDIVGEPRVAQLGENRPVSWEAYLSRFKEQE